MNNYLDLKNDNDYSKLKGASNIIKNGGLVLFPTETVYGIGADALNSDAVKKIFLAKGRKEDNPLILHISDMNMLKRVAKNITKLEYELMNQFWPGPFTIILNKTDEVPYIATGNLETVGIRMPSNNIARKLIEYSDTPIAAPSANISGRPSGTNIEDIFEELSGKVDYIINGGATEIGIESTVVRVISDTIHILRPGKVTENDLRKVCNKVIIDKHVLKKLEHQNGVLSPGMKYRHYAPKAKCVLVNGENNEKVVNKINEIAFEYSNAVILGSSENISKYVQGNSINIGSKYILDEISKNIFSALRKADLQNPEIIIIEGVKEEGLGLAIMNRLIRACEYNYIKV